ncbi:hypothetical protein ElP_13820 [Tautonia plasticadhaerens]|uniref:Uncharacterized protein n=1 Tax=Tautonia plasticadhaerens TaxID=2527974 RepID=A0A518GY43_9BACT|nr:hypothetical protein ElP_13820 [Tautonia plasticadhaerens]
MPPDDDGRRPRPGRPLDGDCRGGRGLLEAGPIPDGPAALGGRGDGRRQRPGPGLRRVARAPGVLPGGPGGILVDRAGDDRPARGVGVVAPAGAGRRRDCGRPRVRLGGEAGGRRPVGVAGGLGIRRLLRTDSSFGRSEAVCVRPARGDRAARAGLGLGSGARAGRSPLGPGRDRAGGDGLLAAVGVRGGGHRVGDHPRGLGNRSAMPRAGDLEGLGGLRGGRPAGLPRAVPGEHRGAERGGGGCLPGGVLVGTIPPGRRPDPAGRLAGVDPPRGGLRLPDRRGAGGQRRLGDPDGRRHRGAGPRGGSPPAGRADRADGPDLAGLGTRPIPVRRDGPDDAARRPGGLPADRGRRLVADRPFRGPSPEVPGPRDGPADVGAARGGDVGDRLRPPVPDDRGPADP